MGSGRTTPTAPLCAAVVSDATEAATKTPCAQSRASNTSGATRARRPPKRKALIGTPCGSSQRGEIDGHWRAGAVERAVGGAALSVLPPLQGWPRPSVSSAGPPPPQPPPPGQPALVPPPLVEMGGARDPAI